MSVRLTKKSFVSAPTRSVNTPCGLPPWLVPITRMPPTKMVISQAVKRNSCARSSINSSGVTTSRREMHAHVHARRLGCTLDTQVASQHDHVGHTGPRLGGDAFVHRQHFGQAGGLVALPVLLWRQTNAGTVGAAALVR